MKHLLAFLFPKRLGRLSYLIRAIVCSIPAYVLCREFGDHVFAELIGLVLLAIYEVWFILLPRILDTGMKSHWIYLAFVPGANVFLGCALMFRRSDPRQNPLLQHRDEPRSDTNPAESL